MTDLELFICWLVWSAAYEATRGSMRHPLAPARSDLAMRLVCASHTPAWRWV